MEDGRLLNLAKGTSFPSFPPPFSFLKKKKKLTVEEVGVFDFGFF